MSSFILSRPSGSFGAWLHRQAGEGSPAGLVGAVYGQDIGEQATPADVRGVLLSRQADDADCDALMEAVRGWLAASIPLDFNAPTIFGSNLIAWPVLKTRLVPAGGTEVVCAFCGESSLEHLYIVVALLPEGEQFVCRSCAPVVPGGKGAWEAAEIEHRIEGEEGIL